MSSPKSSSFVNVGASARNEVSGSAWDLPEVEAKLQATNGKKVPFNTCACQTKDRDRFLKSGVWAGRLEDTESLQKVCRCPAWIIHTSLIGKRLTARAAEYPTQLCEAVAKLVVNVWKRTLNLEWWWYQVETKSQEVSHLQKAWLGKRGEKGGR